MKLKLELAQVPESILKSYQRTVIPVNVFEKKNFVRIVSIFFMFTLPLDCCLDVSVSGAPDRLGQFSNNPEDKMTRLDKMLLCLKINLCLFS